MSLRLTLLSVVALIATCAISAPTALAGEDAGPAQSPVVDTTAAAGETAARDSASQPASPPESSGPAVQEPVNGPVSEASNEAQAEQAAAQSEQAETEPSDPGGMSQSQDLQQGAQVEQDADSEGTAAQGGTNLSDPGGAHQELGTEAESEASNEAEVRQDAQQEQDGSGGAGSAQVQRAEQDAEINQDAHSQALAEQQAPTDAPSLATPPAGTTEADWSAILTQVTWAGGVEELMALAQNGSLVFQAIWQVQQGCSNHCARTSQSQSSTQYAGVTQDATAIADGPGADEGESSGGASPSTARALNESVTIQFVWQTQIGCVAFCVETTQTQTAAQSAQTSQSATAEGGTAALAENLSRTLQLVWQLQQGCRQECYGTSQIQVIDQGQETTQAATATSGAGFLVPVLGADGAVVLPGWLVALAKNLGVTIQTIYQFQQAVCAEYCEGDSQLQTAAQEANVTQAATARAGEPPAPIEEPPAGEPPVQQGPTQQAAADEPRGAGQPPASASGATALAAISNPSSPASRRLRSQLIKLASDEPKARPRSLVLVLGSDAKKPVPRPWTISSEGLAAPFAPAVAEHHGSRRPAAPAAKDSGALAAATSGVAPSGTTDGGPDALLWVLLLAASLAFLPALRRLSR